MTVDSQTTWRQHATNIGLIILAILALYWRVFFLGDTIIDVNTLDNQLPWGYSAPGEVQHPYNRRDPTDMYLTREYFIVQAYRDGELPLWNPYTMAGHPIYADGVTRIFSPFLLVYTFLELPLGYSVARIAEVLLGAIFLYLFLIAIRVSPRGALLGALVFALSAHSLFHLTGLGWWGGLMWLPLIFLFMDRAVTGNDLKPAMIAGIFLAMQFYCGYMPNQIYYVTAIICYYLFFGLRSHPAVARAGQRGVGLARVVSMLVITLGVGLALSATQWMPVLELLGFSNRRVVPTEAGYIYLPPWYILTLVFPNLFGTAYDPQLVTLFTGLNVSHDHSLYVGIAALLPLGFVARAWLEKRKTRKATKQIAVTAAGSGLNTFPFEPENDVISRPWQEILYENRLSFFVGFAVFALLVMMAAPLYVHATQFIPVLRSIRVIVRAGVMFTFAVAVLVGFGVDLLMKSGESERLRVGHLAKRFALLAFAFLAVAILTVILIKMSGFIGDANITYVAGTGKLAYLRSVAAGMVSQLAPPKTSILVSLAFIGMVYFLFRLWQTERIKGEVFFWLLVTVLLTDLSLNSLQYDQTHKPGRVFPATQITETLRSLPPGRVLIAPSGIESNRRAREDSQVEKIIAPPNTLLPYRIATVTGKDQLFPKAYREFCSLIEPQPHLSHVVFNQTSSPFFDLLNVKYVLTHATNPAPSHSDLIMKAEGVALYENKNALPRAFFVQKAIGENLAPAAVIQKLQSPDFDGKTTALLDRVAFEVEDKSPGEAKIIADRRNQMVIETENDGEGVLVVSDNWYPGWQATIDGAPAEILRANTTMRAVRLPAGRHVVSFRFVPQTFWVSVYLSIASILAVLLSFVFWRKKRSRVL